MNKAKTIHAGAPRHKGDETHLLREIIRTHQLLMAGFSRKVGIPASRLALMRLVAVADTDIGTMDLARKLGINAAAVTRQVKDMEKEGIVRRRADSRDGRRSYVCLTAKGLKLFNEFHDRGHDLERDLVSSIGANEVAAAVAVLEKVRGFIEDLSRGETP